MAETLFDRLEKIENKAFQLFTLRQWDAEIAERFESTWQAAYDQAPEDVGEPAAVEQDDPFLALLVPTKAQCVEQCANDLTQALRKAYVKLYTREEMIQLQRLLNKTNTGNPRVEVCCGVMIDTVDMQYLWNQTHPEEAEINPEDCKWSGTK